MNESHSEAVREDGGIVRRYDYTDASVVAADLGVEDGSVDVADGTAIVVATRGDTERQYEFDLPEGEAEAFINNGVVTVEVKR
ncbi:DUF7127 family protein [Halocalculus aciditolerans]|uniref:Hsp20/alpha crystallin family protein n=1 Tax=Halocalculus aciditolerans TaxID=1383812 RepID=A0A830FGJ0_9EURY|nr:hypothetical protein [Halocalculus aciditolerans]GGL53459.1 hypothetical protein GCM10009039_09570 [Halocalculus aciditolerans]